MVGPTSKLILVEEIKKRKNMCNKNITCTCTRNVVKKDDPSRRTISWQVDNLYPELKKNLEIFFECSDSYNEAIIGPAKKLYGHVCSYLIGWKK